MNDVAQLSSEVAALIHEIGTLEARLDEARTTLKQKRATLAELLGLPVVGEKPVKVKIRRSGYKKKTDEQREEIILAAIRGGASSRTSIHRKSGLHHYLINRSILDLLNEGKIVLQGPGRYAVAPGITDPSPASGTVGA